MRFLLLSYLCSSCLNQSELLNEQDEAKTVAAPDAISLSVLSWNIDGLDEKYTVDRADGVCDVIVAKLPDVVYLQEIVPVTWDSINQKLGSTYSFFRKEVPFRYYHILLIRKSSGITVEGELEMLQFPDSKQGRFLLQLPVKFHGLEFQLMTSHLESMNHYTTERKAQLKTCFSTMNEQCNSQSKICILAGDMNLMDREAIQVGVPDGLADTWEASEGRDKDSNKYTWDSSEPRFRLDRMYYGPVDSALCLRKFQLVGASVLSKIGVYPSDHLGLYVEFFLRNTTTKL